MLKHAAKRLLILLPAAWFIASVVFLLSKIMPGSAAEMLFDEAAQNANGNAKLELRQQAYQQMLHRTGQDLPLFYVRLATAAEPDTLYKITPEKDQQNLKKLILTYGNWPEISRYYGGIQAFRKKLAKAETNPQRLQNLKNQINNLLAASEKEEIETQIQQLKKMVANSPEKVLAGQANTIGLNFQQLLQKQTPALNYLPKVSWQGFNNQYHNWFIQLMNGNLGESGRDSRPVVAIIAEAFRITGWLAVGSFLPVTFLALEIGMFLSRKSKASWQSPVLRVLYILESLPLFIIALAVLTSASYAGLFNDFPEETGLILAAFCLVLANLPYLTAQSYGALQQVLTRKYVLTARAKGLSEVQVLRRHAFRNSLLPIITLLADFFPALLAGTVVLEVVFSLPGIGRLLVASVLARDYNVIAGLVLLMAFIKMLAHLLADLLYTLADPRISR